MRIAITLAQFLLGGTETYAVTVAEQLERLGHPTMLHAPTASDQGRELAASRGLRLSVGEPAGALAESGGLDAIIAQDASTAYALAALQPGIRQIFVIHGIAAFEHPPKGLEPTPTAVVLNDRVGAHAAALACRPELARLRQPIDIESFRPRSASRPRARRVLMLSNYMEEDRLRMLEGACADLGLDLVRVGAGADQQVDPKEAITGADIVVGYGRSILEAMAMGRAAYVWDRVGGDGWVTPESYAAFEADGFSGAATDAVIDGERLREDFAAYRPELGTLAVDLARAHSATKHAGQLVALLDRAEPIRPDDTLQTLAMLVRAETRATIRAGGFEYETKRMWDLVAEAQATANKRVEESRNAAAAEVAERQATLDAILRSRTWRLMAPLRKVGSWLRRLRRDPS